MNIPLKLGTKPVRQRICRLNQKYKEKVKVELDKMLDAQIIELIEKSGWTSPMVVQEKNTEGIMICVDLRKMNDACLHDPFPKLFIDELLENVRGQETYSFTYGFFGYHQIKIVQEDHTRPLS
jgi:hypothetical protein